MAYDPNNTDRSYLYGCLFAIADKAEKEINKKHGKRLVNVTLKQDSFSLNPYRTWQEIEKKLFAEMITDTKMSDNYTKLIDNVMNQFRAEDFTNNDKLEPIYTYSYHNYLEYLYQN